MRLNLASPLGDGNTSDHQPEKNLDVHRLNLASPLGDGNKKEVVKMKGFTEIESSFPVRGRKPECFGDLSTHLRSD